MAQPTQPSVAAYFNNRKRSALDDVKLIRARKVLLIDEGKEDCSQKVISADITKSEVDNPKCGSNEIYHKLVPNKIVVCKGDPSMAKKASKSRSCTYKRKPNSCVKGQQNLQTFVTKITNERCSENCNEDIDASEKHATPPASPVKTQNAMDKVSEKSKEIPDSLSALKLKLCRSSRLAELKASLSRFNESSKQLNEIEKVTSKISSKCSESPKLQNFKSIALEVELSPQKVVSPEKRYLSPKKDVTVRKNLLNLLSPTKNAVALCESPSKKILEFTSKPALTLPFKYRYIAEMFRSIDTICQILYNRKETITMSKLKPAVENMTKRNMTLRCMAQIKHLYPNAFKFQQEKLRVIGGGKREERWDLVIIPCIGGCDHMTADILLSRRRILFDILLEKVKDYHNEFLVSLDPPMVIPKDKITRWHPEFDIERVPDIAEGTLPKPPEEQKFTSGQEVLEKAREMFNCNTRMEQALERLKSKESKPSTETCEEISKKPESILKGIPKALLEKVRQKQAAKALISMTRPADKEEELKVYSRLSELARLTKNLFVSEKKGVLKLDDVVEKLGNCYRISLTKTEMEDHIKLLVQELPEWLLLHKSLNKVWFLKLVDRDADLNLIRNKLEDLTKRKSDQLCV